jgi:hypothetical protein
MQFAYLFRLGEITILQANRIFLFSCDSKAFQKKTKAFVNDPKKIE